MAETEDKWRPTPLTSPALRTQRSSGSTCPSKTDVSRNAWPSPMSKAGWNQLQTATLMSTMHVRHHHETGVHLPIGLDSGKTVFLAPNTARHRQETSDRPCQAIVNRRVSECHRHMTLVLHEREMKLKNPEPIERSRTETTALDPSQLTRIVQRGTMAIHPTDRLRRQSCKFP